jgi:hypothetical protein
VSLNEKPETYHALVLSLSISAPTIQPLSLTKRYFCVLIELQALQQYPILLDIGVGSVNHNMVCFMCAFEILVFFF